MALLERIIQASSNPGDVVLDPFCGCGTTIGAAEKPGRDWFGIDPAIAGQLAISLIKNRRQDTCGRRLKFVSGTQQSSAGVPPAPSSSISKDAAGTAALPSLVRIIGEPTTPNEAATLAEEGKSIPMVGDRPLCLHLPRKIMAMPRPGQFLNSAPWRYFPVPWRKNSANLLSPCC